MYTEQQVIGKLLKIADKRQQTIKLLFEKWATLSQDNVAYLTRAVQLAGANSGVNGIQPKINVNSDGSYNIELIGIQEGKKEPFLDTFNRQIASQRPELDGKVNFLF